MPVTRTLTLCTLPRQQNNPKLDTLKRVARNERLVSQKGSLVWTSDGKPLNNEAVLELMLRDQVDLMSLLVI